MKTKLTAYQRKGAANGRIGHKALCGDAFARIVRVLVELPESNRRGFPLDVYDELKKALANYDSGLES